MADFTLAATPSFPVGATVGAYPRSNWLGIQQDSPTGAPPGSPTATATVAPNGQTGLTGLVDNTRYWAYANVGGEHRYVGFWVTPPEPDTGGGVGGGAIEATISGNPQVGQTLTASAPDLSNPRYQWKRDGVALTGATAVTKGVTAGDVGHQITCTVTGTASATSNSLTGASGFIPLLTLDSIGIESVQPHRGGGANISVDNGLSAIDRAMEIDPTIPILDGGDIQVTSDSVLVCMHDPDVDRTTDGTGLVSSMTLAQFQALNLKDPAGFVTTEHPPTFSEWLDTVKLYGRVCTPEGKDASAMAQIITMCDAKGLHDSVILGSFSMPRVQAAKAAGFATYLAQSEANHLSSATVLAQVANVDYIAYEYNAPSLDDAWLQPLVAAGMKAWPFTFSRQSIYEDQKARLAALSGGPFDLWMVSSNDPFYMTGNMSAKTSDDFAQGVYDNGMLEADGNTRATLSGGWLVFASGANSGQQMLLGFLANTTTQLGIQGTFRVDTAGAATDHIFLLFGAEDDTNSAIITGGSSIAKGCYQGYLRFDGSLRLGRWDNDVFTAIGTPVATGAVIAGDQPTLKCEFVGSKPKVTRVDTGHSNISVSNDTTYRGPYRHVGKAGDPAKMAVSAVSTV